MQTDTHKHAHCCRSIVLVFILSVCSEVFGIAEQRHTPCHLPAVSQAPQSFMSARLVMRADRKRWDSPISPPTHTEGDRLSGDKATGCTFLCQHACVSESVCTHYAHYHTSAPQRHPLITLNFSWHFSYTSAEVTVSLSVFFHSLLPPLSLSLPILPVRPFFFPLHPFLSKFDAEPSGIKLMLHLNLFFVAFFHLTQFVSLSRCWLPLQLLLRKISVLNDSYCTCVIVCVCV